MITALVDDDSVEPCVDAAFATELGDRPVGGHKTFLQHIFGVIRAAQKRTGLPIQANAIIGDQLRYAAESPFRIFSMSSASRTRFSSRSNLRLFPHRKNQYTYADNDETVVNSMWASTFTGKEDARNVS